jgi:excisionase family DNA binding protein
MAFELKMSKQDLVAGLVEDMKIAPGFTRRRTEVVEVDDNLAVGRASFLPWEPAEVLGVAQAADLLQVDADVIEAMAVAGELPGRQLGDDWRFSRRGLLRWLAGEEGE